MTDLNEVIIKSISAVETPHDQLIMLGFTPNYKKWYVHDHLMILVTNHDSVQADQWSVDRGEGIEIIASFDACMNFVKQIINDAFAPASSDLTADDLELFYLRHGDQPCQ